MQKSFNILYIDLNNRDYEIKDRNDLNYLLGGVALATELLEENCLFNQDPLERDQPIIFTKGPMNTIFPVATKTCCMFKSPLTGELGESYGGLRLSMAMSEAGYEGIVIKGGSHQPIVLHIDGGHVEFLDGNPLWGLNTDEATRLLHDRKGRRGLRSILTIGEGGENEVSYACGTIDTYRHFGRLGLGCVLGSKKVKAIIVEGNKSNPVKDFKRYKKAYDAIYKKVTDTDLMEKYHGLGTSINVMALNDMEAFPTKNFLQNSFDKSQSISGEYLAENRLMKQLSCSGCPIGCIHIGLRREKFGDPHEYRTSMVAYDHELIYALGSMLGIGDCDQLLDLIEAVEMKGLDAISTGVLMAWITEAFDKGMINLKDVLVKPSFGEWKGYLKIIENIVAQPNEFYKLASKGTFKLAERYGGLEFAMILGKTEVAGYHTGYGNILGQAVGARHSHLDNAGYGIDQELNLDKDTIVAKLVHEEIIRNMLNSLVICLFARKIYDIETIIEALGSIGIEINEDDLYELGKKTFLKKIKLKEEMGFSYDRLTFPKRFFETNASFNKLIEEEAYKLLQQYKNTIEALKSSTKKINQ